MIFFKLFVTGFCFLEFLLVISSLQLHNHALTTYIDVLQLEELKPDENIVKKINTTSKNLDDLPIDPIENQRREKVKDAMVHAWTSYEKYAWGHDELQVHHHF